MDFTELVLAGVVSELPDSTDSLSAADALAYRICDESDLSSLKKYEGELPIIVLGPSGDDSGEFPPQIFSNLEAAAEIELVKAVEIGIELVRHAEAALEPLRAQDVDLIVSYRNYEETPDKERLSSIVGEASEYGDLVYIETMAKTGQDTLNLLNAVLEATENGILIGGACMGEIGRHTRVDATTYGSKLAYAPLTKDDGAESSRQYTVDEIQELNQELNDPTVKTSLHHKLREQFNKE